MIFVYAESFLVGDWVRTEAWQTMLGAASTRLSVNFDEIYHVIKLLCIQRGLVCRLVYSSWIGKYWLLVRLLQVWSPRLTVIFLKDSSVCIGINDRFIMKIWWGSVGWNCRYLRCIIDHGFLERNFIGCISVIQPWIGFVVLGKTGALIGNAKGAISQRELSHLDPYWKSGRPAITGY